MPLVWGDRARLPASPAFVLLWVIGMVCAVGAAVQAKFHRLVALTLMGGAGLVTCLTFVWFSAPDLALTQLVVEVVTTVLFLLGLRWLPMRLEEAPRRLTAARPWRGAARDLLLAVGAGGGLAALSYAMLTRPAPQSISPFFLSRALPEGGGTNVVNVMLVDFRAFDTSARSPCSARWRSRSTRCCAASGRRRRASSSRPSSARCPPTCVTDLVKPRSAAGRGARLPDGAGGAGAPAAAGRAAWSPCTSSCAGTTSRAAASSPAWSSRSRSSLQYMVGGHAVGRGAASRLRPPRWIAVGLLLAVATGLGAVALGLSRS